MSDILKDTQRRMLGFILLLFAVGIPIGGAACALYIAHVVSDAKYFHAFIMLVGAGFTFPMFVLSIRLMLKMYYKALEQEARFAELIDTVQEERKEIRPLVERGKAILEKVEGAVDRLTETDKLERAVEAISVIPEKLDALHAPKGEPVSEVEVPEMGPGDR